MGNRMNKKKTEKGKENEEKLKERVTEKLEVKTSKTKRKRNIFVGIYNTNNRPWFFNSISSHLFIIVFSLLYGWCNRFIFMLVSKVRCNLNCSRGIACFRGKLNATIHSKRCNRTIFISRIWSTETVFGNILIPSVTWLIMIWHTSYWHHINTFWKFQFTMRKHFPNFQLEAIDVRI